MDRKPSDPPLYEYSDVVILSNPEEDTVKEKNDEDEHHDHHDHHEHKKEEKKKHSWFYVAYPFIAILATVLIGVFGNDMWPYSWLCLLTIPLFYTFIGAVRNKNPLIFCYPVFLALIYLIFSFIYDIWHPLWVIFLTIPIYYIMFGTIRKNRNIK